MRAKDGNLPVDRHYHFVECFYSIGQSCDNCGTTIMNVAVIKDDYGNCYQIGMECLQTFVNLTPDELYQAKKEYRKLQKLIKFIKNCSGVILCNSKNLVAIVDKYGNRLTIKYEKFLKYWQYVNENAKIVDADEVLNKKEE